MTADSSQKKPDRDATGSGAAPDEATPSTQRREKGAEVAEETPLTQQIGRVAVAIVAILFGIFAAVNLQYVGFDWIFGETEVVQQGGERVSGGVPLILLLIGAFVFGAIIGAFLAWRQARSGHRRGTPQG